MLPLPPRSTLFPYTTLFRSQLVRIDRDQRHRVRLAVAVHHDLADERIGLQEILDVLRRDVHAAGGTSRIDRKSTRLNSSHANISYAVFCLKKKKLKQKQAKV